MSDASDIRQSTISSKEPRLPRSITFSRSTLVAIAAVIIVGILAFWGGVAYQKHNDKGSTTSPSAFSRAGGFGGRFAGGSFGTVSSVSSTSISVTNSRTGANKTYAITSSTQITDNGGSATTGSIATGDNVIVIPSSSNSSDAARIIVNPNFGGGQFGGPGGSDSSSTN